MAEVTITLAIRSSLLYMLSTRCRKFQLSQHWLKTEIPAKQIICRINKIYKKPKLLTEDNPVIQEISFFFLRAKDLGNRIILGDRCSSLFQVLTANEYNWILLKPCQVLILTSAQLKKCRGKKCIICHLCWIRFYIKSRQTGQSLRNCRLPWTAYRTSKSAQALILFNWENSMVVSSFPTTHMDEPMAGTATDFCAWTLSAKSAVAHMCSKGYCHLSLCILAFPPTTLITPREKFWKSKQRRIKIISYFTLFRKMRSLLLIPTKTNNSPQDLAWNKSLILLQITSKSSLLNKARFNFFYLFSW